MSASNPYLIPGGPKRRPWFTIVNVSGGRSSAYLLARILDAHGGVLPDRCHAVFANTGKERPETLDFVARIQSEWSVPITWLEYRYRAPSDGRPGEHGYAVVNHNSASRDGRPWHDMERSKARLPSVQQRICTSTLKVGTINRWAWREHGVTVRQIQSVIGFRYDEPKRWKPAVYSECRAIYPMVDARVTRGDVGDWWSRQTFDLGIPSAQGNCDLCYLKGRRNLLQTIRAEPDRAQWWIDREARAGRTLRVRESFASLLRDATLPGLFDGDELGQAGRGARGGDDDALPCFCTD